MRKYIIILFSIICLIAAAILIKPSNKIIYEEKIDFDNQIWQENKVLEYNFDIINNNIKYDIGINITHSNYKYRNLILFSYLYNDSVLLQKDTFNIQIYDKHGVSIGSGMTEIKKMPYILFDNYTFLNTGSFRLEIEQALRIGKKNKIDSLESLYNISLIIREVKYNPVDYIHDPLGIEEPKLLGI